MAFDDGVGAAMELAQMKERQQALKKHIDSANDMATRINNAALRDQFAMHALQGMMANGFVPNRNVVYGNENHDMFAIEAYRMADAMLNARK